MVETISDIIQKISPYYKKKGKPEAEHILVYDSPVEGLEPIYFFIIDLMESFGLKTEKLVDNFSSSPGSGHFGELGQRATIMQQQGSKILGDINMVLRSILNLIYDLKDFQIRLKHYDDLKSKEKAISEAARLALKQIWMDKVDIHKGGASIKAMAVGQQMQFTTLIDAFLSVKDEKDVDRIDLNERVKRILRPRIQEFNIWVEQSNNELRKRYELERNYLKSQVNSLKLYSKWAKPYLRAAQQLEQKEMGRSADLVKTFNTIIFELTLLGKSKINMKEEALAENLPRQFAERKFLRKIKRDFYVCVLVDFYFRGIPQRMGGQQAHYAFGGKTTVTFRAYVLNEDELKKLDEEILKSDVGDVLQLIEGATTESLGQLQKEIDYFLSEQQADEKKFEEKPHEINPFLALIGFYERKGKKSAPEKKEIIVEKDSWIEAELIRPLVAKKSEEAIFNLFNIYKKAHGMASYI